MPKFLIEVPHDAEQRACTRAVQVFLESGSHFLTHADWGCLDGVHCAWLVVEVESKAEAMGIVPPAFRGAARVVGLNQWSLSDLEPLLREHGLAGADRSGTGG